MTGVPHDHPSVHTVRATLERHGSGLRVAIPEGERERFPADEVVRVVVDGRERHARIESHLTEDRLFLPGIYDSPARARSGDSSDGLDSWADDRGRSAGDSVLLDVVDEGFRYGLRAPSESATYEDRSSPDDDLASIARQVEDDSRD